MLNKYENKIRIMLLGPLPPPMGGTTVLFQLLIEELASAKENVIIKTIDVNIRKISPMLFLKIALQILHNIHKVDIISIHASIRGIVSLSGYLYVLSKVFNKKLAYRIFGGNFYNYYSNSNLILKFIIDNFVLQSDLLLVETKYLHEKFTPLHKNVQWFPNHRKMYSNLPIPSKNINGKLKIVFISHIRKEKGIFELIEAAESLPDVQIDVYGPFYDGLSVNIFENKKVKYLGALRPEEVIKKMAEYDALILPSYKEGYPGIVIEALSCGLAVLCTNLPSLKEMFTEEDVIMFEPKNKNVIIEAINQINNNRNLLYELRMKSLKKASEFDSKILTEKYIEMCKKLFEKS